MVYTNASRTFAPLSTCRQKNEEKEMLPSMGKKAGPSESVLETRILSLLIGGISDERKLPDWLAS